MTVMTVPVRRGALRTWTARNIWVWAVLASVALWLLACALSGSLSVRLLLVNATLAVFLGIAGVAQMTVIASGDGSFDFSLPYVITFSAILSAGVLSQGDGGSGILLAVVAAVLIGATTGLLTAVFKMPAMIASLSTGYVVYSLVLVLGSSGANGVSKGLGAFIKRQVGGAGMLLVVGAVVGVAMTLLLTRTVYGRHLHAMGQSRAAAHLSGVRVVRMVVVDFAVSGLLGGFVGILLAAYNGGAFQNIGNSYLMGSVAAVVIGGVPVTGGRSSVPATMLGALVMTLLVTVLDVSRLDPGLQYVLQGVAMILIVTIAQLGRSRRA